MTEKEKNEKLIQENLTVLLEEFTRDQQVNNQILRDLKRSIDEVALNMAATPQRLSEDSPCNPTIDSKKILNTIRSTMIYCYQSFGKDRPVMKQVRFQFFPEKDTKLFYKMVFGRWFLMLIIIFTLSSLYRFCLYQSDNSFKIELKKAENDRLEKAWDSLYRIQNVRGKKKMDNIFQEIK